MLGLCIQLQLPNPVNVDSESKNGLCVIEQILKLNFNADNQISISTKLPSCLLNI